MGRQEDKQEQKAAAVATKVAKMGLEVAAKAATKAKKTFEKAAANSRAKRQRTEVPPPRELEAESGHVAPEDTGTVSSEEPESTEQLVAMVEELIGTPEEKNKDAGEQTAETAAENAEEQTAETGTEDTGEQTAETAAEEEEKEKEKKNHMRKKLG